MRRFIADTNQKGNFFNVTPARILDLAFFAGSPRPGLVLEIGDWMLYPLLPQIDRLRGWAGYPCSGDEAIPEGSKWTEIPLLGEKKEKKIPCGKKKPYGPVHWYFWAILWSSDFCSVFFSYDSPILDFSLYSPRMVPPPSVHSFLACLFWRSRRGKRRCMDSRPDKCRSDISCHGEDLVNSLGR